MRIGKVESPKETKLKRKNPKRAASKIEESEYKESKKSEPAYEDADEELYEYGDETGIKKSEHREVDEREGFENSRIVGEDIKEDSDVNRRRETEFKEIAQREIPESREYGKVILQEESEYDEEMKDDEPSFKKAVHYEEEEEYGEDYSDEFEYGEAGKDENIENGKDVNGYIPKDSEAVQREIPEKRGRERIIANEEAELENARPRERKPERRAVKTEKPNYDESAHDEKPKRKETVRDEETHEYRAGGLSEAPVMKRRRTEYEHTRAKIEKPERSKVAKDESQEYNKNDRRKEAELREINNREKSEYRETERNPESERRRDVQSEEAESRSIAKNKSSEHYNKIRQQVYQPDMRVTGVIGKKPTIRLDRSPTIRLDDPENKEIMHKKARIIKIPEIAGEDIEYSGENQNNNHHIDEDTGLEKETQKERKRARRSRDTEELEELSIDRRKVASAANGFQDITNITGNPKKKNLKPCTYKQ